VDQQTKNLSGANDKYLKEMHDMTAEARTELERLGDDEYALKEVAFLLRKSWDLKKSLSDRISPPIVEDLISKCITLGVDGYKLLGAGNGGFLLTIGNAKSIKNVEKFFGSGKCVRFKFVNYGATNILS
jgi:D-glycero-alpha-D-manno-heptose-7-phosphate kinase